MLVPSVILAANTTGAGNTIKNPIAASDFNALLVSLLKIATEIGSIVVVFMIIYCGFLFVTAQGNEEKLTTAKRALTWTLIGAAILLGANAIALAVKGTVTSIT